MPGAPASPSGDLWVEDLGPFKMVLDRRDLDISEQVRRFGWYRDEQLETRLFEEVLAPGMTVLDLGANVGFYTLLARSRVGGEGRVIAFEPAPANAALIRASVEANAFTNVEVVEAAVSDHVGRAPLYLSPDLISEHSLQPYTYTSGPHPADDVVEVATWTVDAFLASRPDLERVDLVKMDIEGSESRALAGMGQLLRRSPRLMLIVEFWLNGFRNEGRDPRRFLADLLGWGFALQHIDELEQRVYPVEPEALLALAAERTRAQLEGREGAEATKGRDWYTNLLCLR